MPKTFSFREQKTMYGGKTIAGGDVVFIFASENEGGSGLLAGRRRRCQGGSKKAGDREAARAARTPTVRRTATAKGRLGRAELKPFSDWNDGRPETELNFKFYRQATNKIVGVSDEVAAFLGGSF